MLHNNIDNLIQYPIPEQNLHRMPHQVHLAKIRDDFIRRASPWNPVFLMVQATPSVLSRRERQIILSHPARVVQNANLYEVMKEKDLTAYRGMKKAFETADQHHICKLLGNVIIKD